MMRCNQVIFAVFPFVVLGSNVLLARQSCGESYELCSPTGATISTLPPVGTGLSSLYPDLVQAVNLEGPARANLPAVSHRMVKKQVESAFCCAHTSQCLLLSGYGTPFCWDRFTTNFYFPDGSYGSIVAGNYTSASGVKINLIYGDWESTDGKKGNIYSGTPTMMPDTSTMPMPTPWTSSGVGSAIPASELGSSASMTGKTSLSLTMTISAITLPSTTISIGTSACGHCNFTIEPGLTGLPPTGTGYTNGSGIPVTTVALNGTIGTGVPSASSSIYSTTNIIPPFTNNEAISTLGISQKAALIAGVYFTIWIFVL